MKSEDINILNDDASIEKALVMTDGFTDSLGYDRKKSLQMRLLVEEAVGMLRTMVGEYKARLSLEDNNGKVYVRMHATTDMDIDKKSELLSVSKSGKNASVKGFMSKISDMIQNALLSIDNISMLQTVYGGSMVDYGYNTGTGQGMGNDANSLNYMWTLQQYKDSLSEAAEGDIQLDELEKSIVASLADDVIVGVKKNNVTLEIIKQF